VGHGVMTTRHEMSHLERIQEETAEVLRFALNGGCFDYA